jgi:hypothetical protein
MQADRRHDPPQAASLTTLYQEDFLDIAYDPATLLLYADWKGYQSVDAVKRGCERMLALMVQYDAYRVLNDNTHVKGIWIGAAEWAATNWFPRMKQAGMKRFAWVYSPSRFSRVSTDTTLSLVNAEATGIKMFNDKIEAVAWLYRHP